MLKIGDRVKVISGFAGFGLEGKTGRVIDLSNPENIGVEFDKSFSGGHNCNGHCKQGHGRFGAEYELRLINNKINVRNLNKILCLKKAIESKLKETVQGV